MWKVFPFRELSNQEPSGPRRQTSPALGLAIKALSVTDLVGQTLGEAGVAPPPTEIPQEAPRAANTILGSASNTALVPSSFQEE